MGVLMAEVAGVYLEGLRELGGAVCGGLDVGGYYRWG